MISPDDIQQVIHLVQLSYNTDPPLPPQEQQHVQHQLVHAQKSDASWGLIGPLLAHSDVTVRFFGAHTASVKITRDWDTLPPDQQGALLSSLLEWTIQIALQPGNAIVVRKLFVALSSLVLRLSPDRFPSPLQTILSLLCPPSSAANYSLPLEFYQILVEEVARTGLLGQRKLAVYEVLKEEEHVVVGTVGAVLGKWLDQRERPDEAEMESAFKCLESWIGWGLGGERLNPLIPILIELLNRPETFVPASTCMQEVLSNSVLKDGRGSKVLTEPLLVWVAGTGRMVSEGLFESGEADETAQSMCKLLVALGEHSTDYLALHLIRPDIQIFFRLMLGFSGFEGYFGLDEDLSDIPLGFWSLFQESLTASPHIESADTPSPAPEWTIAKEIFTELFEKLRRKCTLPAGGAGWMKDQVDRFRSYRSECGDAMVTSFYILRSNALGLILSSLQTHLGGPSPFNWEEIEVTLHCLRSVQEAVPVEENEYLPQIFSQQMIGQLPMEGDHRVRATAVALIGDYSSWLHSHPPNVLPAVSYIVPALEIPALSSSAAKSLKRVCDVCRGCLTGHIAAFGELYAKVEQRIEPEEKARVLEAITSVVQALPPTEAINPIKNITDPVLNTILQAIEGAAQLPEEAKSTTVQQIHSLTAIAKGLTPSDDFDLDPEEADEGKAGEIALAREAGGLRVLRERLLGMTARVVEIWGSDAEVADALSSFLKAMTSSLESPTLLSLDAEPLLRLIAGTAQRNLNGIWLSLAETLVGRLSAPVGLSAPSKAYDQPAVEALVRDVAGVMITAGVGLLREGLEAMGRLPDIVESLFKFVGCVAARFPGSLLGNPTEMVDLMMELSVVGLGLQERYSLQAVTGFITTSISRSRARAELVDQFNPILLKHGLSIVQAVILGAGGRCPRSVIPHLAELLAALVTRLPGECAVWLNAVLSIDGFPDPRASGKAKDRLKNTVLKSRTTKRVREALNEFALVARGLENSAYGNAAPL